MKRRSNTAKLFDVLAETYDAVGVDFFEPIALGLIAALAVQPGERALDIGCGKGAVLFPLAAAVGASVPATGLDLSPRMVRATDREATRRGLNIDVRVGDAMAPRFPKASFDVVTSSLVLFFLPDPLAALKTWRELLTHGGRIGVSTFGSEDARWAHEVEEFLRRSATPELREAHSEYERGPFSSDEGVERLLVDAGFHNVRTVRSVVSPRFADCDHWFRWSMSVGQRQFWEALPATRISEVKATSFVAVDKCRDEQGRIGFDQAVRYTLGERL